MTDIKVQDVDVHVDVDASQSSESSDTKPDSQSPPPNGPLNWVFSYLGACSCLQACSESCFKCLKPSDSPDYDTGFVALVVFVYHLPFAIAALVFSQEQWDCDKTDPMGLTVSAYLLVGALIAICGPTAVALMAAFFGRAFRLVGFGLAVCAVVFNVTWWIAGGVLLFRSELDCIKVGATPTIYVLVMWSLGALCGCCLCKITG